MVGQLKVAQNQKCNLPTLNYTVSYERKTASNDFYNVDNLFNKLKQINF